MSVDIFGLDLEPKRLCPGATILSGETLPCMKLAVRAEKLYIERCELV